MQTEQVSALLREVADRLILPRFRGLSSGDTAGKTPGDLVTITDREAEVELARLLRLATPDAMVIGEEGVFGDSGVLEALARAEHAWVIDPIDGTKNLAKGSPDFGVMLAEVRSGATVRAWIWQPLFDQLFIAEAGAGVTRNGEQLAPPCRNRTVPLGATYIPVPGEDSASVKVIRSWGSCAIDYPKLITGEVDFLSYRSMFPWDHLPGALMVTELGGRIATVDGKEYRAGVIGRRLLSAVTPQVWEEAHEALFC